MPRSQTEARKEIESVVVRLRPRVQRNYEGWRSRLQAARQPNSMRRVAELAAPWADAVEAEWRKAIPSGLWADHELDTSTQDRCTRSDGEHWPDDVLCGMSHEKGDVFHLVIEREADGTLAARTEFCRQIPKANLHCIPAYDRRDILTFEDLLAGAPCKVCGVPLLPIAGKTAAGSKQRWPAEQPCKINGDCRGASWRIANSPFAHCAATLPASSDRSRGNAAHRDTASSPD